MSKKEFLCPLSRKYWQAASGEFKNLRSLVLVSLMVALSVALGALFIMVGENLRIYFTFLVAGVGALIGGPLMALAAGAAADFVGYILVPTGAYFPGYMLSRMLTWFVFAIFFYRSRISVLRILAARAICNFGINATLGSLWTSVLIGRGYLLVLQASLLKNTLLLPLEVLLMVLLLRLLLPSLERMGLVPAHTGGGILPLAGRRKPKTRSAES